MTAVILIIFSAAANLLEGICVKKYGAKHSKGGFIFTALISLFVALFFCISNGGHFAPPAELLIFGIAAGIVYATASFLTYLSFQYGSFAMSMLILSYSLILPTGYGLIFLHESVSIYSCLGFGVMLISLYLVREKRGSEGKLISAKWLLVIIPSFVGNGVFSIIQRMQQIRFDDKYTNEFMIITMCVSFVMLFALGIIKDGKNLTYILKKGIPYTLCAGVSNGITNMLAMAAYNLIAISLAVPIQSGVKIILSFLVSAIIFKEQFEKRQICGVLLGTVALILLNIGG